MKKIVRLTESELVNLIKKVIAEDIQVAGRKISLHPSGALLVPDKTGKPKKVRLSAVGSDFNIVKLEPTGKGYNVCGKSGRCQSISPEQANTIISFVDNGSPTKIDSGSWSTPNVSMRLEA
jgi:hypothetical protein